MKANLDINWFIEAQPGTDEDPGFPGVVTQFVMAWGWSNEAVDDADTSSDLSIAFNNVALDVGAVFSDILGPIVRQLKSVTGPLDPVVKTLYAPIPVLSDLSHAVGGDDVTLVSIAKAFSTIAGGPDLKFVDTVVAIVSLINSLPEGQRRPDPDRQLRRGRRDGPRHVRDAGQLRVADRARIEAAVAQGAWTYGVLGELDEKRKSGASADWHVRQGRPVTDRQGRALPSRCSRSPSSLFNLIMGGDVTLVTFDSGP